MSEAMKAAIARDYDQRSISRKPKKELIKRAEEVDKLRNDVDAFLAQGGKVQVVDGLYSNWDNVHHKKRYNSHEMYKPAGVGDL